MNRRNFIRLAGATGATMLAGCQGDETDTTESGTGNGDENGGTGNGDENGGTGNGDENGGESDVYDVTVESAAARGMELLDWNAQFAGWPNIWGRWLAYERYAQYNMTENEWMPRLIQDWSVDGTTITLNIREDHTYANGDQVTAEDIKANTVMNLATGAAFSEVFDSFNEVDDKTLEIETTKEVNPAIVEFTLLSQLQQAKMDAPYDELYQRYWEDEEDGVASDIQGREPQVPDYVSGIFGAESMDDEQYMMVRNPEHPDAGNVNFERYRFPNYPGNQGNWEAMIGDQIDTIMSAFTPSNIRAEMADHWVEYNFPGYWGVGYVFNHDEEAAPHISKRAVRQAITHAINREEVVTAAGAQIKEAFPTPAAISANVQDDWIDVGGAFPAMQGGAEKAAEVMQDAGYEKNSSGFWAMDGETVSFEVVVPSSWSDWVTATQAVVPQLQDAGFDVEMNRVNNINTVVGEGNFKMAARPWSPGNARSSHPYFPLNWVFGRAYNNAHSYPGAEEGAEIEVPAMDGDGTMSVNVQKRLDDLSTASGDEAKSIVQELAWVSHQDLPYLPVINKVEQSWISERRLSAPDPDDPAGNVKWPTFYAPRVGKMQWQGE
ncbi:dipeptide/oligopeptide/nickel ABC transporter, periplasmic substrate-binding protein [Halorhabdus tiamatea SARL4B]|uniref:Dipeptide/oligopeptide/nickel ABC transporter, periplasmic substrate-binding protein n=1 Tax=Halorhabdus tiamatea SARL4B TaxID=1033806 RepID=F7PL55_9EURY|nr:dipeptide/oligopeptide/nickel ABC transporter, periplasmic substrate-binding protein [Halorhabdus tiamatea SARL4B]